ncbi:MAG: TadE/TadG family type IV pilus assembly protein [Thermoflexus sp.]|jgi:hypothetical protein|uniref:TadE/TadG family type IV pilus assembly protein n=1 Tax=Thermoflexus TaxID=1495649 RepID=UPI001C779D67|nr:MULTISPECIES: TadE/TadG family type IV pilus assembly protein [Thermoflexus]MDT7885155.1 TadE/TadG family type IV pilus assembly protein [Thermoflexus sp.]MDT7949080.1 TadE/TadG family type IV pilus assembly protein [Thermoflexus sp.]QWK10083.1 MAG: pilus assembly protein [Thermoflexus hugenholtzii]
MSERGRRGRRAQSIVELAILLPLFLILIAGLTEIGFAIAAYLSLQDAVREAARFGADGDPCLYADRQEDPRDPAAVCGSDLFLNPISQRFDEAFQPYALNSGLGDDLVISAFGIRQDGTLAWRLPRDAPNGWSRFNNQSSRVTNEAIAAQVGHSPSKGILIVEAYYHYRQRLGLFTWIFPEIIPMYASAWMPLPSVDPME